MTDIWGAAARRGPETAADTGQAPVFADYFDGERALRQRVQLRAEGPAQDLILRIERPEGPPVRWPARDLRRLPDQAQGGALSYGMRHGGGGRLVVEEAEARLLIESLHPHTRRRLPGPPLVKRAIGVACIGAALLAALFFVVLPGLAGLLARVMDPEAEIAMGELHYEQALLLFGGGLSAARECDDPAGQAALDAMTARIAQDVALPYPLHVRVLDASDGFLDRDGEPILNAFAMSGGRIVFLDAMIQAAEHPDEIAAILAHELGHVVNDDPVRHMLQSISGLAVVSVLVGDVTGGGMLGGTAGAAITSSYSRRAEIAADDYAVERLEAVDLPPSALATMFERLRDRYGEVEGLMASFNTHPALTERIGTLSGVRDPEGGTPSLTQAEWAALRGICD